MTINGNAELIVQDAGSYQKILELTEKLETIEALKSAIEEMKVDKGELAETVFADFIWSKTDLPPALWLIFLLSCKI